MPRLLDRFFTAYPDAAIQARAHKTLQMLRASEKTLKGIREVQPALEAVLDRSMRDELVESVRSEMLRREVDYRGLLSEGRLLAMQLISWAETG